MKLFSMGNEEKVFVKKESTEGLLVYPAAGDALLVTDASGLGQEIEFIEDAQLRDSRSRLSPIKGRTNPGEWSASTYVKPSGSLGTEPEAHVLFECLMGKEDATPGVKVEYTLDSSINLPSFSMWVKKGHTVFAMEGCTVNQGQFTVSGGEIVGAQWSGQFMKWYKAGSALSTQLIATGNNHVHVDDAKRFSGENKIKIVIGDDDNTALGYTVTGIDYATDTLTFSPVLAGAGEVQGCEVRGWYPPTSTFVGSPVHGKITGVTIDSYAATLLSASFSISNGIKYYADEMNQQWYATAYGAVGRREVGGTMSLYFRKPTTQYFYKSEYQIQDALIITAGSVTGAKMEVSIPQIEYRTPTISGAEEVLMEIPFIAVATAALDDEVKITFK